jgi:hypothetical protein
MYRIELAPGEETVFRTIDELAVAVRNGVVTSRARIYHNASQKWLPIEFHPHYKHALELPPSRPEAPARTSERTDRLSFAVARAAEPETSTAAPVVAAPPTEAAAAVEPEVNAAVVEEPSAPPTARLAVVPSALRGLPTISYPEVAEEEITYPEFARAEAPAADQPTSAPRSRRPLHLVGAAAVLALGVYAMMSAFSPSRGDAASARAVADRPALPQPDSSPADSQRPDEPLAVATRVDSAAATPRAATPVKPAVPGPRTPAPVVAAMTEPASSGFAPALESRAIVSSSPATVRAAALQDSSIAPAPAALDMALPALPGAESLVPTPRPQGDSGIKRILRAVSGGKDTPKRP